MQNFTLMVVYVRRLPFPHMLELGYSVHLATYIFHQRDACRVIIDILYITSSPSRNSVTSSLVHSDPADICRPQCQSRIKLYRRFTISFYPFLSVQLTFIQLAQEIEAQVLSSQRDINIVKTAVAAKQRDIRMLELTSSEVKQLSKDTKVYQGVGKM